MIFDALRLDEIPGWLTREEAEWLYNRAASATRILEIGCFMGRATCALSWNPADLVVCDTFDAVGTSRHEEFVGKQSEVFAQFWKNVHDRHVGMPTVIVEVSANLPALLRPQFDFIFIDGSHDEESVREDLSTARKLALPGCIVAVHDYNDPDREGLTRAVRDFFLPDLPINEVGSIAWGRI